MVNSGPCYRTTSWYDLRGSGRRYKREQEKKVMSQEPGAQPRAQVRRHDRAVTDEGWIRDLLKRAPYGTLATVRDGQPFVNMNIFVYDEVANVLYLHTARAGQTRSNVEAEERVCFGVSEMGRLLPAPTAMHF